MQFSTNSRYMTCHHGHTQISRYEHLRLNPLTSVHSEQQDITHALAFTDSLRLRRRQHERQKAFRHAVFPNRTFTCSRAFPRLPHAPEMTVTRSHSWSRVRVDGHCVVITDWSAVSPTRELGQAVATVGVCEEENKSTLNDLHTNFHFILGDVQIVDFLKLKLINSHTTHNEPLI